MKVVYKTTYPNGTVYVSMNLTDAHRLSMLKAIHRSSGANTR